MHEVVAAGAADVVVAAGAADVVVVEPEVTSRPPIGEFAGLVASFALFAAFWYASSVWDEFAFTTPLMPLIQCEKTFCEQ